jgi:hypothetical protein
MSSDPRQNAQVEQLRQAMNDVVELGNKRTQQVNAQVDDLQISI